MKETKVSDLQLASYLRAREFPLVRVEGAQHRRTFVFGDVPEGAVLAYYADRDEVSARKLFGAYRDLRGLVTQVL
jgi:hypothetical protein